MTSINGIADAVSFGLSTKIKKKTVECNQNPSCPFTMVRTMSSASKQKAIGNLTTVSQPNLADTNVSTGYHFDSGLNGIEKSTIHTRQKPIKTPRSPSQKSFERVFPLFKRKSSSSSLQDVSSNNTGSYESQSTPASSFNVRSDYNESHLQSIVVPEAKAVTFSNISSNSSIYSNNSLMTETVPHFKVVVDNDFDV